MDTEISPRLDRVAGKKGVESFPVAMLEAPEEAKSATQLYFIAHHVVVFHKFIIMLTF